MEDFFKFPRFLTIFFPLKLIVGDSAKICCIEALFFTFQCLNFTMMTIFASFLMYDGIQKVDRLMGSFMVFTVMTIIAVKCIMLFIKRESFQLVITRLKATKKFDPTLKKDFKLFKRFQHAILSYTLMTILASLITGVKNAINGDQVFAVFLKPSFKIMNPIIFYSLMFWAHFTQCTGLVIHFFILVIPCKLIFVTSMEFKQLGKEISDLKFRKYKIMQEPTTSRNTYQNLLSKYPPKVRKCQDFDQKS